MAIRPVTGRLARAAGLQHQPAVLPVPVDMTFALVRLLTRWTWSGTVQHRRSDGVSPPILGSTKVPDPATLMALLF